MTIDRLMRGFAPLWAPDGAEGGGEVVEKDPPVDANADAGADDAEIDAGAEQGTDKSALGSDVADEGKEAAADWPEDWRERLAGDDKEFAKILKRFASPNGLAKSFKDAQNKIRSGKLRRDMPDAGDEAAMKEWRKAEGIPDDPTGYAIPDSVKTMMTDEDKPMLASFTEFAHGKNLPQPAVDAALEWYYETQEAIATERLAADKEAGEATTTALRNEYGPEYKANMTLARDFMAATPEIGNNWTEARLPDGRRLGDIPEFVMHIVDQAKATFGDTVFATPDAEAKHNSRRAELEKIRDTDFDRYEREGLDKELLAITEKDLAREQRRR